jgi:hypothetical protein
MTCQEVQVRQALCLANQFFHILLTTKSIGLDVPRGLPVFQV